MGTYEDIGMGAQAPVNLWSEASDAEVIGLSLADGDVFAEVFERHFETVRRYASQRLGYDLADELAAETFLIAFDRRHRYDLDQPKALPWLLGISTNLIRRHWRDEKRRLAHVSDDAAAEPADDSWLAGRLLDQELADALLGLRMEEREAVLLLAWVDLSYDEISRVLQVPVGTVRSRISRARSTLRSLLPAPVPKPLPAEDSCHG